MPKLHWIASARRWKAATSLEEVGRKPSHYRSAFDDNDSIDMKDRNNYVRIERLNYTRKMSRDFASHSSASHYPFPLPYGQGTFWLLSFMLLTLMTCHCDNIAFWSCWKVVMSGSVWYDRIQTKSTLSMQSSMCKAWGLLLRLHWLLLDLQGTLWPGLWRRLALSM